MTCFENGAVAHDYVSNILKGPMIKQLLQTIDSYGVIFNNNFMQQQKTRENSRH